MREPITMPQAFYLGLLIAAKAETLNLSQAGEKSELLTISRKLDNPEDGFSKLNAREKSVVSALLVQSQEFLLPLKEQLITKIRLQ